MADQEEPQSGTLMKSSAPIVQEMMKAFGIPATAKSFSVHVAVGSLVEVECVYFPPAQTADENE